jgi:hypothetical protein
MKLRKSHLQKNIRLETTFANSKLLDSFLSFKTSTQIMSRSIAEQVNCPEASLRRPISWGLVNHMEHLFDADIVKECMIEAETSLLEGKNDLVEKLRRVPLSASCSTRDTQLLQAENFTDAKNELEVAEFYALAVNELCDLNDIARLSLCVRSF